MNEKIDKFFDKALTRETSNLYKNLSSRFADIEKLIHRGWSHHEIVEGLNSEGVNITIKTFRTYLYRMRKSDKPASPTRQTDKKRPTPSSSTTATIASLGQEMEDDWNDTEKLIGYRLEDCIRPYVAVMDGKIEPNFPKGQILSREMRDAMTRLRIVVHPSP